MSFMDSLKDFGTGLYHVIAPETYAANLDRAERQKLDNANIYDAQQKLELLKQSHADALKQQDLENTINLGNLTDKKAAQRAADYQSGRITPQAQTLDQLAQLPPMQPPVAPTAGAAALPSGLINRTGQGIGGVPSMAQPGTPLVDPKAAIAQLFQAKQAGTPPPAVPTPSAVGQPEGDFTPTGYLPPQAPIAPPTITPRITTPEGDVVNSPLELAQAARDKAAADQAATMHQIPTPDTLKPLFGDTMPVSNGPLAPSEVVQAMKNGTTEDKMVEITDPEIAKFIGKKVGDKVDKGVYETGLRLSKETNPNEWSFALRLSGGDYQKAWDLIRQAKEKEAAPKTAPHSLMFVDDGQGGKKAVDVGPGTVLPGQAQTAAGINSDNTDPGAVKARINQAKVIIPSADELIAEINRNRNKVGKLDSYWNKFTNNSPIADPETSLLMSKIASFAALQPALHGMRSQQALKEFENQIGGVPKNPDAMIAAVKGIQSIARIVESTGKDFPKGPGSGKMIHAIDQNGKLHMALPGTPLPPGWKEAK